MKRRFAVSTSALLLAYAGAAGAQTTTPGYAVSAFEPSERGSDWFANESLDLRGTGRFAVGVVGDYGYRPLIGKYADGGTIATTTVRNQLVLHAGAAINVFDRVRLGVSVPIQVFADGHTTTVNGVGYLAPQKEQSIGDVRVSLDFGIVGTYGSPFQLAIGGSIWAPTGQRNQFDGDGSTRVGPHLLAAGDVGPIAYALRSAYEYRGIQQNYLATRLGSLWTFGGSVGVRMLDHHVLVGPEVYGQTVISNDHAFDEKASPVEAVLGAHFEIAPGVRINAGGGTFLAHGYGAPSFRGLLGLEFFPEVAKPKPRVVVMPPPRVEPPPPPPDRDGDSVLDRDDACPEVPGVATEDPATNGCPPAPVPVAPPPDPDRDKDGIPNESDACPDAAGPASEDASKNGCPRVAIKNKQITITEQPKFDFGKATLKKDSDALLAEVAKIMTDHPELVKVRVEGHTDSVGNPAYNKKLSEQRATAVVKWLTAHGIASDRLTAIGYGKERPLVANDTEANRALNRRVELHIEQQTEPAPKP